MPVLVEDPCRLLVQGLGRDGSFQAQRIVEYGTNMVAAVHPNRAGMKFMDEVPYFETARKPLQRQVPTPASSSSPRHSPWTPSLSRPMLALDSSSR